MPGCKIVRPGVEVRDIWLGMAEPAREFLRLVFFIDPNGRVDTRDVHPLWEKWRASRKPVPGYVTHQQLNRHLRQIFALPEKPSKSNGRQFWTGIAYRGQDGLTELAEGVTKVTDSSIPPDYTEHKKGGKSKSLSLSALFGEADP